LNFANRVITLFLLICSVPFFLAITYFNLASFSLYFFLGLAIALIATSLIKRKTTNRRLIIVFCFILINLIPFPRNAHDFSPEIGEFVLPPSIGLGWPGAYFKYYLGEGDFQPVSVVKKPIHFGYTEIISSMMLLDIAAFVLLIPWLEKIIDQQKRQ